MWKFIGIDRIILLDYEFIRCTAFKIHNYTENPSIGCGGDLFINDNEDFFRISAFCAPDDSVYTPEHIATKEDAWLLETLINDKLVVWENII